MRVSKQYIVCANTPYGTVYYTKRKLSPYKEENAIIFTDRQKALKQVHYMRKNGKWYWLVKQL